MRTRYTTSTLFPAVAAAALVLVPSGCSSGGGGGGDGALDALLENESRLNTNPAGASTSESPFVCIDGSRIYVIWMDDRTGSERVFFNSSADGGITWRSSDVEIPDGGTGSTDLSLAEASLACDGTNVYVVWEELLPSDNDDIYFNRSTDGGTTWLPTAIRMDTDAAGAADSDSPGVAASGLNVCVVWEDDRDGEKDIRLNRSSDGGMTWLASDLRLDTDAAGAAHSEGLEIRSQGSDVLVVWEDARNGANDIYANRSADGGATWLGSDFRIDTDSAGSAESVNPRVAISGLDVHVTWRDDRSGDFDIYFNHSTDGGATWLANDMRLDSDATGIDSEDVRIAVDGMDVYVVFKDKRNGGDDDIFINVSNDGGATWLPAEMRLDTGSGDSDGPRICADAGNVYVCWEDTVGGLDDVYLRYSTDAGATWIPDPLYAESPPAGSFDSSSQGIACAGDAVWMVWHEDRNGELDVFVNGGVIP